MDKKELKKCRRMHGLLTQLLQGRRILRRDKTKPIPQWSEVTTYFDLVTAVEMEQHLKPARRPAETIFRMDGQVDGMGDLASDIPKGGFDKRQCLFQETDGDRHMVVCGTNGWDDYACCVDQCPRKMLRRIIPMPAGEKGVIINTCRGPQIIREFMDERPKAKKKEGS